MPEGAPQWSPHAGDTGGPCPRLWAEASFCRKWPLNECRLASEELCLLNSQFPDHLPFETLYKVLSSPCPASRSLHSLLLSQAIRFPFIKNLSLHHNSNPASCGDPCATPPTMNHDQPDKTPKGQKWSGEEVGKHNSDKDCWVIIHGRAYDVTEFKADHPGGSKIIMKFAGKDATETYEPIHPPDTLDKYLAKDKHMGEVNMETVEKEHELDPDEEERMERVKRMPILEQCYNLMDFEAVARRVMKKTAWAYYSSGADDEIVCTPFTLMKSNADMLPTRRCEKTTLPTTRYGSALESSTTSRR